jgi:hypothetical protein
VARELESVADIRVGVQPMSKCEDQMRWQAAGLLILREEWPSRRVYEHE